MARDRKRYAARPRLPNAAISKQLASEESQSLVPQDNHMDQRTDTRGANETLARLQRALRIVAELVCHDPIYAPVFRRLEQEIEIEEAKLEDDLLIRARAIRAQNEIGASRSVTCWSLPPAP